MVDNQQGKASGPKYVYRTVVDQQTMLPDNMINRYTKGRFLNNTEEDR